MLESLLAPLGWAGRLERTALGAPTSRWLSEQGLSVSLTHTTGIAACALASHSVGVDVEALDGSVDTVAVAEMQFDAQAARSVALSSGEERLDRFFRLWTLKETALKALGTGFATPADLSFTLDPPAIRGSEPSGLVWRAYEIDCGTAHRLSAAMLAPRNIEPCLVVEEIT